MTRRKSNKSFHVVCRLVDGMVACTRRLHAGEAIELWAKGRLDGKEVHLCNTAQAKAWGYYNEPLPPSCSDLYLLSYTTQVGHEVKPNGKPTVGNLYRS